MQPAQEACIPDYLLYLANRLPPGKCATWKTKQMRSLKMLHTRILKECMPECEARLRLKLSSNV